MNDKAKQLYKAIMKEFNELCSEELSFDDHQRMLDTLIHNSEGFKNKPAYQKEPFITNTPASVIKGYYEYVDPCNESGFGLAIEEYAEELYRQCRDEIKSNLLQSTVKHHMVHAACD